MLLEELGLLSSVPVSSNLQNGGVDIMMVDFTMHTLLFTIGTIDKFVYWVPGLYYFLSCRWGMYGWEMYS